MPILNSSSVAAQVADVVAVKIASGKYGQVGTADDSATIIAAINAAAALGAGTVVDFTGRPVYNCKNIPIKTGLKYYGPGVVLTLPAAGVAATDDVVQTDTFNACTGTTNTTLTATAAPWGFTIDGFTIDTGSGGTGRHALAIFGISYSLLNLKLIAQGGGSALWEEFSNNGEDWSTGPNYRKGDNAARRVNIEIVDAVTTPTVTAPSQNDMSMAVSGVTNVANPTITTARTHFLRAGMTATISGVVGAVGVNGTWTVTSVTSPTQFTITTGAPGVYASGGTVAYHVSAAWFNSIHDGWTDTCVGHTGNTGVTAARRGILNGDSAGGGSATGSEFVNTHVYLNFDVGFDCVAGNIEAGATCQVEGAGRCNVLIRANGGNTIPERIFSGFGGVTMLSIRDANGNQIMGRAFQGGAGNAPPAGFTNSATYVELYNTSLNVWAWSMTHDYNTNAAASAGAINPTTCGWIYMNAYAISTAVLAAGWLTAISATQSGMTMAPTGMTAVTAT